MTVNGEVVIESPIASSMGARVSVTGPARALYLIIGDSTALDSLVKRAGGEVVLRLNGGKMLAVLSFGGYLALRANHQISHIGPVSVDVNRLAKLSQLLAGANGPGPGNRG